MYDRAFSFLENPSSDLIKSLDSDIVPESAIFVSVQVAQGYYFSGFLLQNPKNVTAEPETSSGMGIYCKSLSFTYPPSKH